MTIIVSPLFTQKKVIKPPEGRGMGEQLRPQGKALQPAEGGPQFGFGNCWGREALALSECWFGEGTLWLLNHSRR